MKSKLNVHYFQHTAGEGFGSCYDFLKAHQANITATEFFALPADFRLEIEALPKIEEVDLLIIMGGSMSVNDEANYSWMKLEKRWLRRYLAAGKPAIGVCFGGHLIANSLGASVIQKPLNDLGWSAVYSVPQPDQSCFEFPECLKVLQWHHESFEIPKGAVHLAQSMICRNQVYQIGNNVLGFQFHPEITPEALTLFVENTDVDQVPSLNHPDIDSILTTTNRQHFSQANQLLNQAIEYVLKAS